MNPNVRVFRRDPEGVRTELTHTNSLLAHRENRFKDWTCFAGVANLFVDADGNIFRASCRVGGKLGSVWDDDLVLTTEPITCTRLACVCSTDIKIPKFREPGHTSAEGGKDGL